MVRRFTTAEFQINDTVDTQLLDGLQSTRFQVFSKLDPPPVVIGCPKETAELTFMAKPDGINPLGHSNSVVCMRRADSMSSTPLSSGLDEDRSTFEGQSRDRLLGEFYQIGLVIDVIDVDNANAHEPKRKR